MLNPNDVLIVPAFPNGVDIPTLDEQLEMDIIEAEDLGMSTEEN